MKQELNLQDIYLNQMIEVRDRLNATQYFMDIYSKTGSHIEFDCAILQFRKALEATAYASISPNKDKYRAFRQKSEKSQDFTKDFNATKIFQYLRQINEDFYPVPLTPAIKQSDNTWHFGRKENGFLTKNKFEKIYDRLGKFLHADNPWDSNKQRQNISKDIIAAMPELSILLELHATFIRAKNYSSAWIVELPQDENIKPKIITAMASGDFKVTSQ
ncbi:MAG: hypothetical protein LRY36_02120 [Alphaproteobacteria bacterium]|nr:hypothetical protein [Alphaproteobacteria bacterium]